ncbi:unnamed protein product [Cuscuta campestris]|uniref:Uncharacterized protein n=1 Tax=Cuscuta campestris TaxID=132261 RepID=A0A484M167_9ASTE|nr:unnamed protein product [Cuscuta campestris]
MVPTLEAIQGGGGSMKVGTTGTISSLVSKELDGVKSSPQTAAGPVRKKLPPPSICSFVAGSATSPTKRMTPKTPPLSSSNEAITGKDHDSPEVTRKTKNYTRNTHEIPILESESCSVDETPVRQKGARKGSRIAEIVDIKCGSCEKRWASPVKNPLKKFSFSKLSGTPV